MSAGWRAGAAGAVAVAGLLAAVSAVRASDHLDGPRATADPQADLGDVFAFTSPGDPSRVVLAMTVTPYAGDAATFSPHVTYAFRVRQVEGLAPFTVDPTPRDVVCTFDQGSPARVSCAGPAGLAASAVVGDPGSPGGGPMRVFAGLRSDPAFFDRQGALATVATGRASFTGQNAFAGANVLALVVEVDSRSLGAAGDAGAGAGPPPILSVAAETVREGY